MKLRFMKKRTLLIALFFVTIVILTLTHPSQSWNFDQFQPGRIWRQIKLGWDRMIFEWSLSGFSLGKPSDDWSQSDYKLHLNDSISSEQTPIPKIIWSYWRGDAQGMPEIVQRCMQTWIDYNPDYKIRLVTTDTIQDFIALDQAPSECRLPEGFHQWESYLQADWLRLTLIRLYGGVWLDASTILTGSLNFIHSRRGSTEGFMYILQAFSSHLPRFPMVENWFISSIPNGEFVTKWQREFDFMTRHFGSDGLAYTEHLEKMFGHDRTRSLVQYLSRDFESYLKAHIAAQKIIQITGAKSIATQEACEGPLKMISEVGWKPEVMASKLNEPITGPLPVIIKLRSPERKAVEQYVHDSKIKNNTIYSLYLKY